MVLPQLRSSAIRAAVSLISRRTMASATNLTPDAQARKTIDLSKFNPNNYNLPPRVATLDDAMEPYGSWRQAYEAERKRANKVLFKGIVCFITACMVVYHGGVFDGVIMPNLDNIMEDTQPFEFEKGEDRVSV